MKFQFVEVISKFVTSISAWAPSSPSTGQIWYDSTLGVFRGQKSSGAVSLESGLIYQVDGWASASTFVTAENMDGGTA